MAQHDDLLLRSYSYQVWQTVNGEDVEMRQASKQQQQALSDAFTRASLPNARPRDVSPQGRTGAMEMENKLRTMEAMLHVWRADCTRLSTRASAAETCATSSVRPGVLLDAIQSKAGVLKMLVNSTGSKSVADVFCGGDVHLAALYGWIFSQNLVRCGLKQTWYLARHSWREALRRASLLKRPDLVVYLCVRVLLYGSDFGGRGAATGTDEHEDMKAAQAQLVRYVPALLGQKSAPRQSRIDLLAEVALVVRLCGESTKCLRRGALKTGSIPNPQTPLSRALSVWVAETMAHNGDTLAARCMAAARQRADGGEQAKGGRYDAHACHTMAMLLAAWSVDRGVEIAH